MLHDSTRRMIARAIMAKSRRTCLLQTSTFILNSVKLTVTIMTKTKKILKMMKMRR